MINKSTIRVLGFIKKIRVIWILLVIEGDNATVMKSLTSTGPHLSRMGHVLQDVQLLIHSMRWKTVSSIKRSANSVAHSLARHARFVIDDVILGCTDTLFGVLYLCRNSVLFIVSYYNFSKITHIAIFYSYLYPCPCILNYLDRRFSSTSYGGSVL